MMDAPILYYLPSSQIVHIFFLALASMKDIDDSFGVEPIHLSVLLLRWLSQLLALDLIPMKYSS
jgi:hypothetical protein